MEKRVRFKSAWLPWLLIAPQMAVVLVFFFWPAGQALYQSVLMQDAFGGSVEFVGMENFDRLFSDTSYLASFKTTAFFSILVASTGLAVSLLLAVMANRVVRGAGLYKTLLIWPYAVAPVSFTLTEVSQRVSWKSAYASNQLGCLGCSLHRKWRWSWSFSFGLQDKPFTKAC